MTTLYLASASPRRAKLLRAAGIRFKRATSDYHERDFPGMAPSYVVKKHALGKALAAARKVKSGNVLAADTIIYFHGRIIGKPAGRRAAVKTLLALQDHWHTVYTGVAFLEARNGRIKQKRLFFEKTGVRLQKMEAEDIRDYFKRVDPMDKAGAYAIQDRRSGIVREIKGSFSNAVGLPMERLRFL